MIHLLSSWSTNRWNMTFYGLFLPILSTSSIFYLLSSSSKVDSVRLWSTDLRCRFQLYDYLVWLIVLQDGLLGIKHSMVLCLNELLTANSSNWEKRKRGRKEEKKIKRIFLMRQWIWIIDKCCCTFRNLGGTVQRNVLIEVC